MFYIFLHIQMILEKNFECSVMLDVPEDKNYMYWTTSLYVCMSYPILDHHYVIPHS